MSEKIKYEAVFGDQSLFDDGPDDAEAVVIYALRLKRWYKLQDGEYYLSTDKEQSWKRCRNGYPGFPFLAMRRIIRTPIWTVADRKEGKLPEVGCRVNFCHKLNSNWRTGEIKYIDDQVAVIKADDIDRPFVYEVERVEFKPIESPEEKAVLLEDEFVESTCRQNEQHSTLYSDGVRAAYRKLKGGDHD